MLSGLFGDGMHLEDGDGLGAEPPHGLVRKRVTTALDSKLEVIDFLPFLFFFRSSQASRNRRASRGLTQCSDRVGSDIIQRSVTVQTPLAISASSTVTGFERANEPPVPWAAESYLLVTVVNLNLCGQPRSLDRPRYVISCTFQSLPRSNIPGVCREMLYRV